MSFTISKLAGALFMPLPLISIALIVALFALLLGRRGLGTALVGIATFALIGIAWWPLADRLLHPLEAPYLAIREADPDIRWVMVLGSGHDSDPSVPITSQLTDTAVVRIVEGVRLYRQLPEAQLIVSGWGGQDARPHAELAAQLARELGVEEESIIRFDLPRNTAEEAMAASMRLTDEPFYLVTSASHMTRALALFEAQGLKPIPAPTRHRVTAKQNLNLRDYTPQARDVAKSERAFHEYMGILWNRLRGEHRSAAEH
ncbi:ElyC/SanA/YdcF family protein [Alkalilimnicola ehrlichii]|nr:ElyC/SanA/YdcF family protein [Alkalilimnicola ehrlichii]